VRITLNQIIPVSRSIILKMGNPTDSNLHAT
jgi:hypothetical protein